MTLVHELDVKIVEAGEAGYQGVEIFWEDLNGLVVLVLQPFINSEGLLDRARHEELIVKLELWFKVVKVLGTDMIQIPSQMNSDGRAGDRDRIVSDLKQVARLGLKENPPVRFAYEALSWGAHLDLWEQIWHIVLQVDLPNFGTVIDTYHVRNPLWLPFSTHPPFYGLRPGGESALAASLSRMAATPNLLAKLFYVQLSDAERLDLPLSPTHPYHDAAQKPNMQWSRNARLFPCEETRGGYQPVQAVVKVLLDKGFCVWVSMKVFSRTMSDPDPDTPRAHAARGIESWRTMVQRW
ncbi:4-hydroxyphenylpyruvate dioxygenase [Mycena crocata]|nr:4-hydroxyphenylpyruvate dioxygenase [Mycena crocata]